MTEATTFGAAPVVHHSKFSRLMSQLGHLRQNDTAPRGMSASLRSQIDQSGLTGSRGLIEYNLVPGRAELLSESVAECFSLRRPLSS